MALSIVGNFFLLFLLASPAQDVERWGLIATSGGNTESVERVTRTGDRLVSESAIPQRARIRATAVLDADGCVTSATVEVYPWGSAAEATPLQVVSVAISGDDVKVSASARGQSRETSRSLPGMRFVLARDSWALSAQIVECGLSRGDSVTLPTVAFPNLEAIEPRIVRQGQTVLVTTKEATSRVTLDETGRPVRIAVGENGVVIRRVSDAEAAAIRFSTPDYLPPPEASYEAVEVRIPVTDGVVLAGTLTIPRNAKGRLPAIVLVSGSGPQDRDSYAPIGSGWRPFRELADALSSNGVVVLRFDDRGVGSSTGNYGIAAESQTAEDVGAALAFLRAHQAVDPGRVGVLGHSEGARVAMRVGAEDARLAGLVLMAGAADPLEAARAQAIWAAEHPLSGAALSRAEALAYAERALKAFVDGNPREVAHWDAQGLAEKIRAPVAVFQGGTDRQVPASQAEALGTLFRQARNPSVTVTVLPGLNHLFVRDESGDFLRYERIQSANLDPSAIRAVVEWVVAHLASGAPRGRVGQSRGALVPAGRSSGGLFRVLPN